MLSLPTFVRRPSSLPPTLGVLCLTGAAVAQESNAKPTAAEAITIGHKHALESKILGEKRELMIHTPRSYTTSHRPYPVLYLLDPRSHFTHTVGTVEFLSRNGRMPEMIIVGVTNTDRTRDLTPTKDASINIPQMASAGGADKFLAFLTDELAPHLAKKHRTTDFRLLVGHSFGGLFAIHALTKKPGFFSAMIAISPSLQWNDQALVGRAKAFLTNAKDLSGSLYMTVGNERGGLLGGVHKLSGMLTEQAPQSFRWTFKHMPTETHGSVPHRSTYDGLEFVFDGYSMKDAAAMYEAGGWKAIESHYAKLSKSLGYQVPVSRSAARDVMMPMIQSGRLRAAFELGQKLAAQEATKQCVLPSFWNFLASQYEAKKDAAGAKAALEACLKAFPDDARTRQRLAAMETRAK